MILKKISCEKRKKNFLIINPLPYIKRTRTPNQVSQCCAQCASSLPCYFWFLCRKKTPIQFKHTQTNVINTLFFYFLLSKLCVSYYKDEHMCSNLCHICKPTRKISFIICLEQSLFNMIRLFMLMLK